MIPDLSGHRCRHIPDCFGAGSWVELRRGFEVDDLALGVESGDPAEVSSPDRSCPSSWREKSGSRAIQTCETGERYQIYLYDTMKARPSNLQEFQIYHLITFQIYQITRQNGIEDKMQ